MAAIDLYNKLKTYYVGYNAKQKPTLSTTNAGLLSVLFVGLFVLPFYLFRKTRPSPTLNRDNPNVIRARIQSVTVAVTLSLLTTFYILYGKSHFTLESSLHYLGLYPVDPLSILKSFTLTLVLFSGPLYDSFYVQKELWPLSTLSQRVRATLTSWQGYRNYVIGPLSEELLFRSSIITLHLLAHVSPTKITFLTPLYFGIAHTHHCYEFALTHPHSPLFHALLRSLFQFSYTTIFGWYASFVYIRTGNIYAVLIIHVFCNYMGFPHVWGKLTLHTEPTISSIATRGKEDVDQALHGYSGRELPLRYTVIYYILLWGGAFTFYKLLFPLTGSAVGLASFGRK